MRSKCFSDNQAHGAPGVTIMKKNFVLDTNVLLHSPEALFAFEDNNVVVPITVVEEIDNFKRDSSQLGRSARQAARYLDALRRKGQIAEGVPLREGVPSDCSHKYRTSKGVAQGRQCRQPNPRHSHGFTQ